VRKRLENCRSDAETTFPLSPLLPSFFAFPSTLSFSSGHFFVSSTPHPLLTTMSSSILPPQHPDPSLAAPSPPAPLSEAQRSSLSNLIAYFSSPDFKIPLPTTPPPEGCRTVEYTESLTEFEEYWLSEEGILRFLRATKGDEDAAKKRLEDTLLWRRNFGLDSFTAEYIS